MKNKLYITDKRGGIIKKTFGNILCVLIILAGIWVNVNLLGNHVVYDILWITIIFIAVYDLSVAKYKFCFAKTKEEAIAYIDKVFDKK